MLSREYITPKLPKGIRIRWKKQFDFDLVYRKMKYWLDDHGFGNNLEEEEFSQTVKGDTKEMRIKWYAEKPEGSYFAFVIEVVFLVVGMKEINITVNGREKVVDTGDFEVRMAAYVVKDVKNRYSKQVQWIYENLLVRNRLFEKKRDLFEQFYLFSDEIKKQLERA